MGGLGERTMDSGEMQESGRDREAMGRRAERKRYRDVRGDGDVKAESYCMGERERRFNRQVGREVYQ